jgi:hypothetical protein
MDEHKSAGACTRCTEHQAAVLATPGKRECQSCFITGVGKKFKGNIRTKCGVRSQSILIGFSGGTASRCLVDLVAKAIDGEGRRKMKFRVGVAFINQSVLWDSGEENKLLVDFVRKQMSLYSQFEQFSVLESDFDPKVYEQIKNNDDLMHAFLQAERYRKLAEIAVKEGFDMVLLGSTCDRLAVDAFCNISAGRGFAAPEYASWTCERFGVRFGLPIKDCSAKDVAMYCFFEKLDSMSSMKFHPQEGLFPSVYSLTQSVISNLQSKFCNTIPNVMRTMEKLVLPNHDSRKCRFCGEPISHMDVEFYSSIEKEIFSMTAEPESKLEVNKDMCFYCFENFRFQ